MHPQIATGQQTSNAAGAETPAQRIWAVALIALFTLVFYSLWWNRFLAGNGVDGVFFFSGKQILNGRIPYRDFSLAVPPWDAIQDAFLIRLFGDYLIVPRILGLIERVVLASVIFVWLRRVFTPASAFFGALVGIVVFSASPADPVAGYNHDSTFWAVLAGFCASITLGRYPTIPWLPTMLSGVFAALSFLTKQTTGAGATAAIAIVLFLTAVRTDWQAGVRRIALYIAGWIVPCGLTAVWLMSTGAWAQFVDQVFVSGPSSKGSFVQVFTRPVAVAIHDAWLRQELAIAVIAMTALVAVSRPQHRDGHRSSFPRLVLITVGGIAAVFVARALAITAFGTYARLSSPHRIMMFACLFGSIAAVLYYFARWGRGVMATFAEQQLFLLAGVAAAVAYMHSLSFVVTESMTLPALPFLIALALDRLNSSGVQRAARAIVVAAACGAALTAATFKLALPFAWYGWTEQPVQFSTETSSLKQLAGLRMSPRSKDFIERLDRAVENNRTSSSSEYAFFYLPLTYILTDGYPPTIAFNHFIDVAPDVVCRRDAQTLSAAKPSVIVYTPLHPGEILEWERDFRASRSSGQRDLIVTLDRLTASDYRLVDTLHMPGSERPVAVYVRK
jgi:hypothetical protein